MTSKSCIEGVSLESVLADRYEVLDALAERARAKNELEDVLSCSRSTIDRAIRELDDANLVRYDDGAWTPTLVGRRAYDRYESYRGHLERLTTASTLVDVLSPDGAIEEEVLNGAEAHRTDPSVPDAIVGTFLDRVRGAEAVRLVTPTIDVGFLTRIRSHVTTDDAFELELVLSDEAFARITNSYPGPIDELSDSPGVQLFRSSVPYDFGFWVADEDHVGIIVVADHGIAGLLVNDAPEAVEWANERHERIGDGVTVISRGDGGSAAATD